MRDNVIVKGTVKISMADFKELEELKAKTLRGEDVGYKPTEYHVQGNMFSMIPSRVYYGDEATNKMAEDMEAKDKEFQELRQENYKLHGKNNGLEKKIKELEDKLAFREYTLFGRIIQRLSKRKPKPEKDE